MCGNQIKTYCVGGDLEVAEIKQKPNIRGHFLHERCNFAWLSYEQRILAKGAQINRGHNVIFH